MPEKLVPMVVTTLHKGVFFGYGKPTTEKEIKIERARMCVYWTESVKGVLGLAATGPLNGCRITPQVPSIILRDVTSIMEATKEAAEKWEQATWA